MSALYAGAAVSDISPLTSQFLFGYPHADRWSKGVHDPLLCSALYLDDGSTRMLIITNDIIYFDKLLVREIRQDISRQTGIPPSNIMLSASHTHSAPVIVKPLGRGSYAANAQENDPLAHPHPDPDYLSLLVRQIAQAAREAAKSAAPARIALTEADNTGIGTNRRDPTGPRNPVVPVLSVKHQNSEEYIAVMMACSMHPTVLHEDSLLVSADFPGMTRAYLQKRGIRCPILYASSPAGNQSPRHVTRSNTFEEAERIGAILGKSVEKALSAACDFAEDISLQVRQTTVELPLQPIPSLAGAGERVRAAVKKMNSLKAEGASSQIIRTAECDWFGTERRELLARLREEGLLEEEIARRQPAEIQLFAIGPWRFLAWPGEIFVEFGLEVMEKRPDTYVLAYANGETYGYLVTEEAAEEAGYEASTALFKSPESPRLLAAASIELLDTLP